MLKGLFPRLFGQYREGGLIVGKFTVSNSGATLSAVSGLGESYVGLTCTGSAGQYILALAGGARKITVVNIHADLMDEDDPNDARVCLVNGEDDISPGNGTIPFTTLSLAATPAVAALPDTSILTAVLYVDR